MPDTIRLTDQTALILYHAMLQAAEEDARRYRAACSPRDAEHGRATMRDYAA